MLEMSNAEEELIKTLRGIIQRPIFGLSDFTEIIKAITEYTIETIRANKTKLAQDFIDEFKVNSND